MSIPQDGSQELEKLRSDMRAAVKEHWKAFLIAGILLGPSLVGWLWPGVFNLIFPPASLGTLRMLSQIGVCLFMFVVGMELELGALRHQAHRVVLVSKVSILLPYMLGVAASFGTLRAPASRSPSPRIP